MGDDVGDYKNVCPLPPICSLKNDGPQKCLPSKMFVLKNYCPKKCLSSAYLAPQAARRPLRRLQPHPGIRESKEVVK